MQYTKTGVDIYDVSQLTEVIQWRCVDDRPGGCETDLPFVNFVTTTNPRDPIRIFNRTEIREFDMRIEKILDFDFPS